MLASEFVSKIVGAGFTYEKVTQDNLKKQPNGLVLSSPGFRVNVGDSVYLWELEHIGRITPDELNSRICAYTFESQLMADFNNLPEKG